MSPLLTLVVVFLAAPSWGASLCVSAYRVEEHQTKWEITRAAWAAECARGSNPVATLARLKEKFIEACLEKSMAAIQASAPKFEQARELCAMGAPGRKQIPVIADLPRPPLQQAASAARVGAIERTVNGILQRSGVESLYGERAAGDPGAAAGGPRIPSPSAARAMTHAAALRAGANLDRAVVPAVSNAVVDRALNIQVIQSRIKADGVSAQARDQARSAIGEMLAAADYAVVQNMADRGVQLYIIPKDKQVTDLEPFKHLKGKKTFDGRLWDDVRGVANTAVAGGGYATAVSEESLLIDKKPGEGYPKNFVLIHEFGHMVQIHGLPTRPVARPAAQSLWTRLGQSLEVVSANPIQQRSWDLGRLAFERVQVEPSFAETLHLFRQTSKRPGRSRLGDYADANEKEFFAELTAAYFDVGFEDGKYNDLKLLMKERPELAHLMFRIYGPAPTMRGR